MKKLSLLVCAALALVSFAPKADAAGIDLYNSHEFNLDIFGTRAFSDNDSRRLFDEDANGGGLALTYFLTEYIGVGLEGSLYEASGDTLATTAANAVFRLPMGDSGVAVYGLAGLGFIFNPDDLDEDSDSEDVLFMGHAGGGVEWRFTEGFGIFSDVRYNFVERGSSDYASARVGMRFVF